MTKKEFIKLAKKKGYKIKVNDITKARPLSEICGQLHSDYPIEDLIREIRNYWIDIT